MMSRLAGDLSATLRFTWNTPSAQWSATLAFEPDDARHAADNRHPSAVSRPKMTRRFIGRVQQPVSLLGIAAITTSLLHAEHLWHPRWL